MGAIDGFDAKLIKFPDAPKKPPLLGMRWMPPAHNGIL